MDYLILTVNILTFIGSLYCITKGIKYNKIDIEKSTLYIWLAVVLMRTIYK